MKKMPGLKQRFAVLAGWTNILVSHLLRPGIAAAFEPRLLRLAQHLRALYSMPKLLSHPASSALRVALE